MKKFMFAILISYVSVILTGCDKQETPTTVVAPAPTTEQAAPAPATESAAIEQTTCPVMDGQPISKDLFVDYNGKRVYFCCDYCVGEFKKNPEKYIAKLPQFKDAATKAEAAVTEAATDAAAEVTDTLKLK